MTYRRPAPALIYAPSPCPQCGSVTFSEAEDKCTATQGMSGDYECPGTDCQEGAEGLMMFPTAESAAALDAWYHEQGTLDDAEERALNGELKDA